MEKTIICRDTTGYTEALQNVTMYVLKEEGWYYSLNKKWSLTKQELVDYYNDNLNNHYNKLYDLTGEETPTEKETSGLNHCYYCIEKYLLTEVIDALVKSESTKIRFKVSEEIDKTKKEIKKIIDHFDPLNC